jgi:hypothetical protein
VTLDPDTEALHLADEFEDEEIAREVAARR